MTMDSDWTQQLYQGLQALAESAFPKQCSSCGQVFEDAESFIRETESINTQKSGLKQSIDDDDSTIVELFRNCPCGSTLMDFFSDRRDLSEAGNNRRERFGELMEFLTEAGLEAVAARAELLKVMRGEKSEILNTIKPPKRSA